MAARVLIVEDERLVALGIQRSLERLGYAPLGPCTTVAAAVETARRELPDVVLMDVRLEGHGDGVEAARAIRQEPGAPVIFLTAFSDDETLARAADVEPAGYLTKPFDERELRAAIEIALHKRDTERAHRALDEERTAHAVALRMQVEELERLALTLGHDLREPVRGILGLIEAVRETLGADAAKVEEDLARMERATLRIGAVVDKGIADACGGWRVGRLTVVQLDDALDLALAALDRALRESDVRIQREPLPRVAGDVDQLALVFQNLLHNAVKYRSDQPPVIRIGVRPVSGGWEVSVADNGVGIDPAFAAHVFDESSRAPATSDRPGMGVGLSIAKRIIERHGGAIALEPAPVGTTLRFTLKAPPGEAASIGKGGGGPRRPSEPGA